MSKYRWHITRKNEAPKVVRHYKWVTKMFSFVLRNPAMFKNRELTIFNHGKKVRDMTWKEIADLMSKGLKEGETRKIVRGLESESNE